VGTHTNDVQTGNGQLFNLLQLAPNACLEYLRITKSPSSTQLDMDHNDLDALLLNLALQPPHQQFNQSQHQPQVSQLVALVIKPNLPSQPVEVTRTKKVTQSPIQSLALHLHHSFSLKAQLLHKCHLPPMEHLEEPQVLTHPNNYPKGSNHQVLRRQQAHHLPPMNQFQVVGHTPL
jgi:hypothetical protein